MRLGALGRVVMVGLALGVLCAPRFAAAQQSPSPGAPWGAAPPAPAPMDEPVPVAAYPARYTLRPLTLPALQLRANAQLSVQRFDLLGEVTLVALGGGVGFGIVDDFEVGLGTSPIAPLAASARALGVHEGLGGLVRSPDSLGFLNPTLYARYRMVSSPDADVGFEFAVTLPRKGSDSAIMLGVPIRARGSESFVLDASVSLLLFTGERGFEGRHVDPVLTVSLLPRFAQEHLYFGADTGFALYFEDPEFTFIPLLFELGGTLPMGGGVLDAYARGGFPALFVPGSSGDVVITDFWELTFGVRAHFGFGAQ